MSQGKNLTTLSGIQRLLEGGLILSCMIATYILLALGSFDPNDPGWSQSQYQGKVANLTGSVGAWIADVLYYFFGFIAYLIPLIIAATGWFIFNRAHKLLEIDYFSVGLRIIGFMLMILSLAALVSMNADDMYVFSAGGVAGDVIGQAMLPYFNTIGTTLLLLCFIAAGFTLTTGVSMLTLIELTGYGTIWLYNKIKTLPALLAPAKETDDTRGFMSLVEKFRQSRDEQEFDEIKFESESQHSNKSRKNSDFDDSEAAADSASQNEYPEYEDDSFFGKLKRKMRPTKQRQEPQVSSTADIDTETAIGAEPNAKASSKSKSFSTIAPWVANDDELDAAGLQSNREDTHGINAFDEDEAVIHFSHHQDDDLDQDLDSDIHDNEIAFDTTSSQGALTAERKQALAVAKAKIVDGIVILPGQDKPVPPKPMTPLPSISLLDVPNRKQNPISEEELDQVARLVETKLADFNIIANVVGVYPGPVITRFELELAPGVKASKITNLSKDLARSLLAESVRVVEVIPGKAYVGLELPNKYRETVYMRDVLDCPAFSESKSNLSMVLGQDIAGDPLVVDLGKMPHLLVAGTTGSGKSVGVNAMITSLLYKSGPDDVRFIMIDPKMLELSVYEGIPHLLCEVVTDMKEAANALRWCVGEMERRYKLMSALGVRNLKGYNIKIKEAIERGAPIQDPLWKSSDSMEEQAPALEKLPSIVVVVDEFADMIMIVGKKVEELIARIAQKARAAGIHLILATQRPSVDVITGLIKANIPTRIAFQVSSRIDSRTILDQQGAETLLGMGDMLYLPPGTGVPIRVHGAFIDDHEVHNVVADWHARGKPQYIDEILNGGSDGEQVLLPGETAENDDEHDALYDEAVAFVTETRRGSISSVQRKFKIGYNRAARIIEMMESQGIVSSQGHNGNREVLAPPPPRNSFD
ncbi:DNA translocase FtsK [Shewanella sp. SR44-3]|uniref:DNA translocase FtsK n=2 Tax=unclassified Shewanella TaxID=196818 RepID=UPI0015FC045C|nr:DNA translocase FtsK 4TM domain-containing protein [Shewanella sp. SR44-3]MBB1267920.1 DNA translocase FtsK 4TM domain-containing protein [Shewanella sp. SR44-3]